MWKTGSSHPIFKNVEKLFSCSVRSTLEDNFWRTRHTQQGNLKIGWFVKHKKKKTGRIRKVWEKRDRNYFQTVAYFGYFSLVLSLQISNHWSALRINKLKRPNVDLYEFYLVFFSFSQLGGGKRYISRYSRLMISLWFFFYFKKVQNVCAGEVGDGTSAKYGSWWSKEKKIGLSFAPEIVCIYMCQIYICYVS